MMGRVKLVREGGQRDRVMAVLALGLSILLVGIVIGVVPSRFAGAASDAAATPTPAAGEPLLVGEVRGCLEDERFAVARSGERRLIAKRTGFRPTTLVLYADATGARAAAKGRWVAINNAAVRYGRSGDPRQNPPQAQSAFEGCLHAPAQ